MNRAVIICQRSYVWELQDFYKELIEHNKEIIRLKNRKSKQSLQFKITDFFSGYVVDCVEYTIMFVEGIHNSLRLKLGRHFMRHEPTILYDRMMIFHKVLYDKFYEIGGFYRITMCRPLEEFLNNPTTYCGRNVPTSVAQRSILKLDMTRKCKSIREFFDCQFAANPDELQKLDAELGLPTQH